MRVPLAFLAMFLDGLGRDEAAATIAGHAFSQITQSWVSGIHTVIAHLREVLGDETYESLARDGESMTPVVIANYAYDQIDRARTELNAVSE